MTKSKTWKIAACAGLALACASSAQAQVKIAQIYAGNNTGLTAGNWRYDYIILKNTSNAAVDVSTWSVQYAAATGTSWSKINLTGSIPANGYYLIRAAAAASGNELPLTPDVSSTAINMASAAGKLILLRSNVTLGAISCPIADSNLEDFVGWGTTANCSEGLPAPLSAAATTLFRMSGGCFDTNQNSLNFEVARSAVSGDFMNTSSAGVACDLNYANVSASASASNCQVSTGADVSTITVTVSNSAATSNATNVVANITLPSQLSYVAASETLSQGALTPGVGTLTWNVGTLGIGGVATLTYHVGASGSGAATTAVSVSATETDPNPGDNNGSVNLTVLAPSTVLHKAILCNHPSASASQNSIVVPNTGFARPWLATQTASADIWSRIYGSPDGSRCVLVGNLDNSDSTTDRVIIAGHISGGNLSLNAVVQKGFTDMGGGENVGATLDYGPGINDSGQISFSGVSNVGTSDYVARRNTDGTITVIARESTVFPGVGPATYGANNNHASNITNDGRVSYFTNVAGGDTVTTTDTMICLNDGTNFSVLGRESTAPAIGAGSVPGGESATWKAFDSATLVGAESGFFVSGDGNTWMAGGTINTLLPGGAANTAVDQVLVRNGVMLIQEGKQMASPEPFPGAATAGTFNHGYMMDGQGNWLCYGSNTGTGQDWVVGNDGVLARTGDPIFTSSTEHWTDANPLDPTGTSGYADCYFGVSRQGSDVLIAGISDRGQVNTIERAYNGLIVWNNQQVICREGDPVDVNGDGINNDNVYVGVFRNGRMWIGSNRKAYVVVSLRADNWGCGTSPAATGHAVLEIPLPPVNPPTQRCQPADIAADDGTPLPTDLNVHPNGGVNEGDYNSFFQGFFDAAPNCDIANDDGTALPPFGTAGTNGGVNEGDYNCFFQKFFDGCPA